MADPLHKWLPDDDSPMPGRCLKCGRTFGEVMDLPKPYICDSRPHITDEQRKELCEVQQALRKAYERVEIKRAVRPKVIEL